MKIEVKVKQEHLLELLARGRVCITVDGAAVIQASDFVLRNVVELVRGEDVRIKELID